MGLMNTQAENTRLVELGLQKMAHPVRLKRLFHADVLPVQLCPIHRVRAAIPDDPP